MYLHDRSLVDATLAKLCKKTQSILCVCCTIHTEHFALLTERVGVFPTPNSSPSCQLGVL